MYINITSFFDVKLVNVLDKYQYFVGNLCFFLHNRKITYALKKQAANYFHYLKIEFKEVHTYLFTPWSTVLLEKLTSLQLVKKFPAF